MDPKDIYAYTEPIIFEAESAPEIVGTFDIEGQRVAIVRYATLTMPTQDSAPVFGRTDYFAAIPADAKIPPLTARFFANTSEFHRAGDASSQRRVASTNKDFARCATAKAAAKAARERIERNRLHTQYAPIAEGNIGSLTHEQFEALEADAEIQRGDLVVVYTHGRYRIGVAIKVTKTRVECLAATPSGQTANGVTRTKGAQVRLLWKAEAPSVVPATAPAAQASPNSEPRTPRGRWAVGLPPERSTSFEASLADAAADFNARTTNQVTDVSGRPFGAGALVECVDPGREHGGPRGRIVAVGTNSTGHGQWVELRWEGCQGGMVRGAHEVRVVQADVEAAADLSVVIHEGHGDNEHGVPRRMLEGSLRWQPYDGGEWKLTGYGHTFAIPEEDVAGAQAWAAGLLAKGHDEYDIDGGMTVARWEHHRDAFGDWWEPVAV